MPGNQRIGVDRRGYNPSQTRIDQSLRTRPGPARVVARLQRHISRAASEPFSGMLPGYIKCDDLGVVQQVIFVPALT
jgi:hypothetical protein